MGDRAYKGRVIRTIPYEATMRKIKEIMARDRGELPGKMESAWAKMDCRCENPRRLDTEWDVRSRCQECGYSIPEVESK